MAKRQTSGIGTLAVGAINKAPLTAVLLLLAAGVMKYASFESMERQMEKDKEAIVKLEIELVRLDEKVQAWIEFNGQ